MCCEVVNKNQENYLKTGDYTYLKSILNSSVNKHDLFNVFIDYIINKFNFDAGFVVSNTLNIRTINLSPNNVEKNIHVYQKLILNNKPLLINKLLYGFYSSIFIPIKQEYLFVFQKQKARINILNFKQLKKEILIFLYYLRVLNRKIVTCELLKVSQSFVNKFNKISTGINFDAMLDMYIKTITSSSKSFSSITCYKICKYLDNASLVSYCSNSNLSYINYSVKKEILLQINCTDSAKDYNLISIFNDNQSHHIVAKTVTYNETYSYIFLYEVDNNHVHFRYDLLINKILSHINLLVNLHENKKYEFDFKKYLSMSYFSSGIVHFFNNFSQSVTSRLELIKLFSNNNAKLLEQCNKIAYTFEDGKNLFKRLLLLINNQNIQLKDVSFTDFIYDIYTKFQITYGDCLDLEIDNLDEKYLVECNETHLFCAIWEILLNAFEFSRNDDIDIKLKVKYFYNNNSKQRNFLKLYIDDIGKGMSNDVLARAFEPFFSTKNIDKKTRISPNLNGLGLTISYAVITSIGGYIDIDSVENKGTRVKITLPIKS